MRSVIALAWLTAALLVHALPAQVPDQLRFGAALSESSDPSAALDSPLLASIPDEHRTELATYLATYTEPRLVHVEGEAALRWITEGDKALLVWAGQTRFVDITDADYTLIDNNVKEEKYPAHLSRKEKQLRPLFDRIDLGAMKQLSVLRFLVCAQLGI